MKLVQLQVAPLLRYLDGSYFCKWKL